MKLNIEVESSSFEKIINDGLDSLPKEDLQTILKQVVLEAFKQSPTLHGALVKEVGDSYYNKRIELGPLATEAIKSVDLGEDLENIKKVMIEDLRQNYRELLITAMLKAMIEKFKFDSVFSGVFEGRIREVLDQVQHERSN